MNSEYDEMDSEEMVRKASEDIASAVAKVAADGKEFGLESLEQYSERVKSQVFADIEEYKERLVRGYALLLERSE